VRAVEVVATVEELSTQLAESKRLLFMVCQCEDLVSKDLRELASSAVRAEEVLADLSRAIRIRQHIRPMHLHPHEIQVIETAFLVDRSINAALARTVEIISSSVTIH
jgi:5-methylcytosine-specific restriction endonuclease McrBC regulatory subunit McrC